MDKNQKSDERFHKSASSSSRRVMWKLSEEDVEEETFDSVVTYRRCPVRSSVHVSSSQPTRKLLFKESALKTTNPSSATSLPEVKEPSSKERKVVVSEEEEADAEEDDKGLSVRPSLALRYRPSYESLKFKRSKDLGSDRMPSTSRGSTSSKLVSDLKLESFNLPPQQLCVVREEAPKFAQGLRVDNDSDSSKNSTGMDLDTNRPPLFSVHVSAPTSSSFAEAARRETSPIKRRSTTSKVATGTTTATEGKKCSSTSSGSACLGPHLPNFRQRQQELHRYRVLVEQRRLDLLELKIAREREEALHNTILFHKKMQIKECKIKAFEDNDCSDV